MGSTSFRYVDFGSFLVENTGQERDQRLELFVATDLSYKTIEAPVLPGDGGSQCSWR
jgi:hypothetical protein